MFTVRGLPDTLVTDNGMTFTSELFGEFMQQNDIHHIRTAPFHPASNGLAECAVQTVKEGLKRMTGDSLSAQLSRFLFKYCLTTQTTSECMPAEMLMGRVGQSQASGHEGKSGRKAGETNKRHDQHACQR